MSYVRWSTKVVRDCPECGNEHFVAFLPEHPDWLSFAPDREKYPDVWADDYPRLPACCCSCWYIYDDVGGWLQAYHAGGHVCAGPNGETLDSVRLFDVEEARAWSPPVWCRHRTVAVEAVADWIADQEEGARTPPPEQQNRTQQEPPE